MAQQQPPPPDPNMELVKIEAAEGAGQDPARHAEAAAGPRSRGQMKHQAEMEKMRLDAMIGRRRSRRSTARRRTSRGWRPRSSAALRSRRHPIGATAQMHGTLTGRRPRSTDHEYREQAADFVESPLFSA